MISFENKFFVTLIFVFTLYFSSFCSDKDYTQSFYVYAGNCNIKEMRNTEQESIKANQNIERAGSNRQTPVFSAISNSPLTSSFSEDQILSAVKFLLGKGVLVEGIPYKINNPFSAQDHDKDNKYPLHIAAQNGYYKVIDYLLTKAPEIVYEVTNLKDLPITNAIARKMDGAVALLFEKMTDATKLKPESITKVLKEAIKSDSQTIIDMIFENDNIFARYLKENYSKEQVSPTKPKGIDLLYPLNSAIRHNQEKAIDWILKYGGDTLKKIINDFVPEENPKTTVFHTACRYSSSAIVEKLIKAGCKTDICAGEFGSPLCLAAYAGRVDIIAYLLSIEANVNKTCEYDAWGTKYLFAPLSSAVSSSDQRDSIEKQNMSQEKVKIIVQKLVDAKANVNTEFNDFGRDDNDKHTPLYFALKNRWFKAARFLKNRGAKLSDKESIKNLLNYTENKFIIDSIVNDAPAAKYPELILKASQYEEKDYLVSSQWLSVKKEIEATKDKAQAHNKYGWTLLHEAAKQSIPSPESEKGKIFVAQMTTGITEASKTELPLNEDQLNLLESMKARPEIKKEIEGLLPFFKNSDKKTLDYLARSLEVQSRVDREEPFTNIIKIITDRFSNPEKTKQRPTQEAAKNHLAAVSVKEIITFLVKNGALIDATDIDGVTALHIAAMYDETGETIEILKEKGANLFSQDFNGFTALHFAANNNNMVSTKKLLEKMGGSVKTEKDKRDNLQRTALHYAAKNNNPEIIELLISKGWNVNAQDAQGNTPLHLAAKTASERALNALIEKKADVNIKNQSGQTAAHILTDKLPKFKQTAAKTTGGEFLLITGQTGNPTKCLEYLLKKDPTLSIEKNNDSKTPFYYAYLNKNKELIDVLLQEKQPTKEIYEALMNDNLVDAFSDLVKKHGLPEGLQPKNEWSAIKIEELKNLPKKEKEIEEKEIFEKPEKKLGDTSLFPDFATALARIK